MSHIFEVLPFYLPDAECPFFYSMSRSLDLCKAKKKSPGDKTTKKRNKKTENVINFDLILGLKRDLANKTNALTKGEGLKMAPDNEKH